MGKSFQLQLLPIFCLLSIAVLFTTIGCNGSQEKLDDNPGQEQTIATADSLVYRITIDDEINPSVSRLVRRGIEAKNGGRLLVYRVRDLWRSCRRCR